MYLEYIWPPYWFYIDLWFQVCRARICCWTLHWTQYWASHRLWGTVVFDSQKLKKCFCVMSIKAPTHYNAWPNTHAISCNGRFWCQHWTVPVEHVVCKEKAPPSAPGSNGTIIIGNMAAPANMEVQFLLWYCGVLSAVSDNYGKAMTESRFVLNIAGSQVSGSKRLTGMWGDASRGEMNDRGSIVWGIF